MHTHTHTPLAAHKRPNSERSAIGTHSRATPALRGVRRALGPLGSPHPEACCQLWGGVLGMGKALGWRWMGLEVGKALGRRWMGLGDTSGSSHRPQGKPSAYVRRRGPGKSEAERTGKGSWPGFSTIMTIQRDTLMLRFPGFRFLPRRRS